MFNIDEKGWNKNMGEILDLHLSQAEDRSSLVRENFPPNANKNKCLANKVLPYS